jgi:hypothetical protein
MYFRLIQNLNAPKSKENIILVSLCKAQTRKKMLLYILYNEEKEETIKAVLIRETIAPAR